MKSLVLLIVLCLPLFSHAKPQTQVMRLGYSCFSGDGKRINLVRSMKVVTYKRDVADYIETYDVDGKVFRDYDMVRTILHRSDDSSGVKEIDVGNGIKFEEQLVIWSRTTSDAYLCKAKSAGAF